jgi:hypothetical protein
MVPKEKGEIVRTLKVTAHYAIAKLIANVNESSSWSSSGSCRSNGDELNALGTKRSEFFPTYS